MPAYYHYRRIEILNFGEKTQHKGSFIFNRSGSAELKIDLVNAVRDWAVIEGKKCCLVFGPNDCFFIEIVEFPPYCATQFPEYCAT